MSGTSTRIPLSVPVLRGNELAYLQECVASGWVSTAGPWVGRFEQALADYLGAHYAVATSSGTAALHVALLVAGVRPGDAVLVPDMTFIAPVNAIHYCGAAPVFIDVDRERWQMDAEAVSSFLADETTRVDGVLCDRATHHRISAILPVHLLGLAAPIDRLAELAAEQRIPLVQDGAQGLGVLSQGRKVGTLGGVTALSFNGNKIVTSGAGGAIVTDREDWANRARYLSTQAKDDSLYFRHNDVGFNYRLSSLHAAIGLGQMEQLESFIEIKRRIHRRYRELLAHRTDLRWVDEAPGDRATYWLVSLTMDGGADRRDRVLRRLLDAGIEARPPWMANHGQAPYRDARRTAVPNALQIEAEGLHLPSSASLTEDDQARVADELARALSAEKPGK